jgi:chaperone required for assembly of F1-ATPase
VKRFYTEVTVVSEPAGWGVHLDGKPVRTPARVPLLVPTVALADAVAAEWAVQITKIEPATMPLTGFANAAIDRVAPDVAHFAGELARFAGNELLCYRTENPAPLVARQAAMWDPLLAWAAASYDIVFAVTSGIVHVAQPPATLVRLGMAFAAFDSFRLAALHPVVTICGSAVIGLAVAERRLDAKQAWAAGQLDEIWQTEQWGEDPLATASREARQGGLAAAVEMLALLGG